MIKLYSYTWIILRILLFFLTQHTRFKQEEWGKKPEWNAIKKKASEAVDWGGGEGSEPWPFPRQDSIARFFVIIFPPLCCRLVILRKKPTRLKLLCALVVFVGLFVSLIPTIFPQVDPKAEKTKNEAHGASRVLWPIIFMLGFVSTSCLFRTKIKWKMGDLSSDRK